MAAVHIARLLWADNNSDARTCRKRDPSLSPAQTYLLGIHSKAGNTQEREPRILVSICRSLEGIQDGKNIFLYGQTLLFPGMQCFFTAFSSCFVVGLASLFSHFSLEMSVSTYCLTPLTVSDLSFLCLFLHCIL